MANAMDEISPEVMANTTFNHRPGAPPRAYARVRDHPKYLASYSTARFTDPVTIGSPITLSDPERGFFESRVAGIGPTNEQDRTIDIYLHGCYVKNGHLQPPQNVHFISDYKNLTRFARFLFFLRSCIMWLGGLFLPMPRSYLQRRQLPLFHERRVPAVSLAPPMDTHPEEDTESLEGEPSAPPSSPKA